MYYPEVNAGNELALSISEAAEFLEENERSQYVQLRFAVKPLNEEEYQIEYGPRAFLRFVSALGKTENYRFIQTINFCDILWERLPRDGMEQLMCAVLPNHPTLKRIVFSPAIPEDYLQSFTTSISVAADRTQLQALCISAQGRLNNAKARIIATLIRRNGPITSIELGGTVSAEGCSIICQAVAINTHLQNFCVIVRNARCDSLHVAITSSSLQTMSVQSEGSFVPACFFNLAKELRSNFTIQRFDFLVPHDNSLVFWHPLVETLESFNYTLTAILTFPGAQERTIHRLLLRNAMIREKAKRLKQQEYAVPPATLPSLLAFVRPFPDLVYRILRRAILTHSIGK